MIKFDFRPLLKLFICAAIPLGASLIAYYRVTACGFIGLDDDLYVYDNPLIRLGLTPPGIRWAFAAVYASTWQPLVWLSYMADVSISGGVDPAALHRTNLGLHLVNTLLLFTCWVRLTGKPRMAGVIALLFAIHPVHVESVAWIAQRKDVLSTLFWWSAVLAYTGYVKAPSCTRFSAVLVLLILGLMAKPMLMTLPAALLLLDFWPLHRLSLRRTAPWKPVLLEKLPLLAPVLISLAATIYVQGKGGSLLDVETLSLWGRFGNAAVSVWRYIGMLLWPVRLAVLYPHPGAWNAAAVLAAVAATSASLVYAWRTREARPWLLFGMLWFLGTLVPVLGLIQFGWHAMADRFMYIPSTGLYVIVAATLARFERRCPPRHRVAAAIGGAIIVLALVARTQDQVALWRDSISLFSHAATVTRDNWMMHNGVGAALSRDGRNDEAAPHFETVIRLKPHRPKAWFNLGHVRFMQGRWADSVACYEQSIALYPTDKALFNLAVAHSRNNNPQAAEAVYHTLLGGTPGHVPTLLNLGNLYRDDGRTELAIRFFRQAVAIAPDELNVQAALGLTLLEADQPIEALKLLVNVLKRDPDHPVARQAVQRAMHPSGPRPE